ncbi:MAG: hypothetical protein ACKO91_18835 [Acidimicrobiales bacterium]
MIDRVTIAAARQSMAAQQANAERFGPLVPARVARVGRVGRPSARKALGRVPQPGAHPGFRLFGNWTVRAAGR